MLSPMSRGLKVVYVPVRACQVCQVAMSSPMSRGLKVGLPDGGLVAVLVAMLSPMSRGLKVPFGKGYRICHSLCNIIPDEQGAERCGRRSRPTRSTRLQ